MEVPLVSTLRVGMHPRRLSVRCPARVSGTRSLVPTLRVGTHPGRSASGAPPGCPPAARCNARCPARRHSGRLPAMTEAREMPIFTRTFDLLFWLLPVTNHFPRANRHDYTRRLLDAAFDLREALERANLGRGQVRLSHLGAADEALGRLRLYLRLAVRWGWLSGGQYKHAAELMTEVGRLLGGWIKVTKPEVPA